MAALTFLGGIGNQRVALIGHSVGGAVAINAGTLSPIVTTVIALSSQLAGAHVAGELAPKPLLLIHGDADTILSHESSQALYDRAGEPKTLRILPGVGHGLAEAHDEVFALVSDWLLQKV
jgi:alpha-beta hydrolase superfamily lysophospholipase